MTLGTLGCMIGALSWQTVNSMTPQQQRYAAWGVAIPLILFFVAIGWEMIKTKRPNWKAGP